MLSAKQSKHFTNTQKTHSPRSGMIQRGSEMVDRGWQTPMVGVSKYDNGVLKCGIGVLRVDFGVP
ncbi:hypothetical protein ABEG63_05820 [Chryseobacterium sp. C39-AII1]|uniref:hypothetical protein n=1 Tax=Chryseobacterium sp. C39-AII1 TaxID=3080332 RepID=UPI00320B5273